MGGHAPHRFAVFIVHLVHRFLLRIPGCGDEDAPFPGRLPYKLADVRIFGDGFRHDIPRPGQSLFRRGHPLLLVDEAKGGRLHLRLIPGLHHQLGQGGQALFPGDGSPRLPLRPEGPVQVFHFLQFDGLLNSAFQFLRQFPLLLDQADYFRLPLLKLPQIAVPLLDGPELLLVQLPGPFLSVAGDEGDRVSFGEELDARLNLGGANPQFFGNHLVNPFVVHKSPPSISLADLEL